MPADDTPATEARRGAVLDPQWEVALRAGQAAEGEQGSVEDELAVLHLLRHARAPQPLDDAAFDRIHEQMVELGELRPAAASGWRAWLRQPWVLGGGAALAAAAVVLVVVVSGPEPTPDPGHGGQLAQRDHAQGVGLAGDGMAATIEAQFAMLEPGARAEVERSIDQGRSSLRGELVASAIAADGRTMGGAP
jgi:hypothetical protein